MVQTRLPVGRSGVKSTVPSALTSTFLHLEGVGPITEMALWRQGVTDWSRLVQARQVDGISSERFARLKAEVGRSERALAERDAAWFARRLPVSEHWRLAPDFWDRIAFLDIETTGLSPNEGIVTVVAIHGGGETRTFVADDNLEEIPAYLRRFPIVATFNGILFDLPFLQFRFPEMLPPPAHIDLRFVLRRLGIVGGLKRIEQVLGIGDRSGVEGVYGIEAVRLWEAYRRGRVEALEKLVRYNRADTVNLEPLLDFAVRELGRRILPPVSEPGASRS